MGKILRLAQGFIDGTLTKTEMKETLANERIMRQVRSLENLEKAEKKIKLIRKVEKHG